jgi:hypothetical protein
MEGRDMTRNFTHEEQIQITKDMAGEPLSALPWDEWERHWPVVDRHGLLTGEVVDSDVEGWSNYGDLAAIWIEEATAGGWTLRDGYAYPPQEVDRQE